jgi:D-alanyl-D-alanine carboxypeptidase
MDANGLSPEQQALLASIMGKSSQAGGGGGFSPASVPTPAASAPAAAAAPADSGKMLSQAEIDALIASMSN